MSRLIKTGGPGQERTRLTKAVVLSIRELMMQTKPDSKTRDLAAFIALALKGVSDTVEKTVGPWEKRDYWIKADRFRREWTWVDPLAAQMRAAVLAEDWTEVALVAAQVGNKLSKIEVSPRHRMGKPWEGAWKALCMQEEKQAGIT